MKNDKKITGYTQLLYKELEDIKWGSEINYEYCLEQLPKIFKKLDVVYEKAIEEYNTTRAEYSKVKRKFQIAKAIVEEYEELHTRLVAEEKTLLWAQKEKEKLNEK